MYILVVYKWGHMCVQVCLPMEAREQYSLPSSTGILYLRSSLSLSLARLACCEARGALLSCPLVLGLQLHGTSFYLDVKDLNLGPHA